MSMPKTLEPATPLQTSEFLGTVAESELRNRSTEKETFTYIEEEDATYLCSESDPESEYSLDESTLEEEAELSKIGLADNLVFDVDQIVAIADEKPGAKEDNLIEFLVRNEIPRKLFHSLHGFITVYLFACGYQREQLIVPLWLGFIAMFLNDFIRFRVPAYNNFLVKFMWFVIRDKEVGLWNGTTFYLAGLSIVFTFFPRDICVMSVLLLSWADTAASTFGRLFGKYTPKVAPGKSLAGSLASAFTGLVVCYFVYGYLIPHYAHFNRPGDVFWTPETSKLSIHMFALISGLAASVSEAIDIAGIDDNFTIPVLSAIFLYASVWAFRA